MRLLYSKDVTEKLGISVGERVQRLEWFPKSASLSVVIAFGDNCLLNFQTSYEGCKDDGDGNFLYQTINWQVRPVPSHQVPAEYDPTQGPPLTCDAAAHTATIQFLTDHAALMQHKIDAWFRPLFQASVPREQGTLDSSATLRILHHPSVHSERSHFTY